MAKKKLLFKDFSPTRDWVVVPDPRTNKTESGIILDDKTANAIQTNVVEVLAIGPDTKHISLGDIVMIDPSTSGHIVDINDETYVMIPEHFCMGIWKSKN
jgi:co-chaperonin GroES (HSP10)